MVEERIELRARRDFARADALRHELEARGYLVEDTPEGTELVVLTREAPRVRAPAEVPDRLSQPAETAFSLVFVAHQNADEIQRSVGATLEHAGGRELEVVVVENGSTDGTPELVDRWAQTDDRLQPVYVEGELGEGAARNCGFRYSRGEIIVSHGPSVEMTGDVFGPIEHVLAEAEVGVVGKWGLVTRTMFDFEPAEGPAADAIEAYLMAARREVFLKAGPWDEGYRFYRSLDLDWSFQVRKAGYELRALPDLPLRQHPHRVWESLTEEERSRLSRKNYFRFLERWGHEEGFRLVCGKTPHELVHAAGRSGAP